MPFGSKPSSQNVAAPNHEQHARHARELLGKRSPVAVGVERRTLDLLEANAEATLAVYQLLRQQGS